MEGVFTLTARKKFKRAYKVNEYNDAVGMRNCKCQNNQVPLPDKHLKQQFCIGPSSTSPMGVANHVGLSNDPSTSAVISFITGL